MRMFITVRLEVRERERESVPLLGGDVSVAGSLRVALLVHCNWLQNAHQL